MLPKNHEIAFCFLLLFFQILNEEHFMHPVVRDKGEASSMGRGEGQATSVSHLTWNQTFSSSFSSLACILIQLLGSASARDLY